MRTRIVPEGVKHLEYEIRQIVEVGRRMQALGRPMTWENIGDPIQMGETVEPWIVDTVQELVRDPKSWAYSPTRGMTETCEYLADQVNRRGGARVGPDDILFMNGVADAVDKVYDLVRKDARIIMPSPCYPTHSSNEMKRGDYAGLYFRLDPHAGWQPDLEDLRLKVRYNPQIVGIAFVNPDNPTGIAYREEALLEIAEIARQHGLFLVCDEIYSHICFGGAKTCHLSTYCGDVPSLALRGISKEYPWPGSRCAWIEILNGKRDPDFREYVDGILLAKMMEVCSTTLPQMSIPRIYADARYPGHLARRAARFAARADEAWETFRTLPGTIVNRVQGAFYFTVVFEPGVLHDRQTLPVERPEVREFLSGLLASPLRPDKRLVYHLMASEGICVVPLSGFHSDLQGFRITLLETDDAKRKNTWLRLKKAVEAYLGS